MRWHSDQYVVGAVPSRSDHFQKCAGTVFLWHYKCKFPVYMPAVSSRCAVMKYDDSLCSWWLSDQDCRCAAFWGEIFMDFPFYPQGQPGNKFNEKVNPVMQQQMFQQILVSSNPGSVPVSHGMAPASPGPTSSHHTHFELQRQLILR